LVKVGAARAHTSAAKGFWVQLGALGKRDSVDRLHQKVSATLGDLTPLLAIFNEASLFKLQAGPYASRREALTAAEQARDALQLTPMVVERR
jgi:rare lipoprotein A